jgi:hypothetical protein
MPKKKAPKPKAKNTKNKPTRKREDFSQAAARIVREATENK